MSSRFSFLVRNRRIHFLLVVALLIVVLTHTMRGQGISIDRSLPDRHSSQLTYSAILDTLNDNLVVSDIQVRRCVRGFSCAAPPDEKPSYWVKIPTKLNLFPINIHLFNYYMYVEKAQGNEAERFIIDVVISPSDKQPESSRKESKWLKHKVASGSYLWLNYLEAIDFTVPIVRDVNVLFGKLDLKDSRPHWKFTKAVLLLPGRYSIRPKLSTLMVAVNEEMSILNKELEFNNVLKKNEILTTVDPKFKIIQVSDMHIGQDTGTCYEKCKYDINTLKFVKSAIEKEGNVGLVIITGDMIDFHRAEHFESVVLKALSPILETGVPFVFTFGDSDHDWHNKQSKVNMLNFIASLPNCYNKKFSETDHRIHGITNGNLKVYHVPPMSEDNKFDYNKLPLEEPLAVITYLDSELQKVDSSQSNYLYRIKHRISSGVDLRLLFCHNPLPNFRPVGKFKLIGSYNEKHTLSTDTDTKFLADVKSCGYKAVAVGHEHENDACIWDSDGEGETLLCYLGVTGESGNTRLDDEYKRRLRVFEIDFEQNRILSWKRDGDKTLDAQNIWSPPEEELPPPPPPPPPAPPKRPNSAPPPPPPKAPEPKPEPKAEAESEAEKEAEKQPEKEPEKQPENEAAKEKEPENAAKGDESKEETAAEKVKAVAEKAKATVEKSAAKAKAEAKQPEDTKKAPAKVVEKGVVTKKKVSKAAPKAEN